MICPSPSGSLHGNRTTALRWARILRGLGHRVTIRQRYQEESCDLMVALHARRSAEAVSLFRRLHAGKPVVLALTGTDLYGDLRGSNDARCSAEFATRMIVLQPLGLRELTPAWRKKTRVILQSATTTPGRVRLSSKTFDVCLVGHLRRVKDPFRAAYAARLLPAGSKVRVLHAGSAREEGMEQFANKEQQRNPRYRWLGGIPRWKARRLIASSRVLVLSSRSEGGANVISEALADRVPVLASKIPGSVGLLGRDYPGYFPVGDTEALARLLARAESDAGFYGRLKSWSARLAPKFHPSRERRAWKALLRELPTGW